MRAGPRETVERYALADAAVYGSCPSHSRKLLGIPSARDPPGQQIAADANITGAVASVLAAGPRTAGRRTDSRDWQRNNVPETMFRCQWRIPRPALFRSCPQRPRATRNQPSTEDGCVTRLPVRPDLSRREEGEQHLAVERAMHPVRRSRAVERGVDGSDERGASPPRRCGAASARRRRPSSGTPQMVVSACRGGRRPRAGP